MSKKNKSKYKAAAQPAPPAAPAKQRRPFVPALGIPYTFTPAAFYKEKSAVLPGEKPIPRTVTGEIVYIHWAHSYFTVEYVLHGYKLRQSIKF